MDTSLRRCVPYGALCVCYEDASPTGPYVFVTKMRPLWGLAVLGLSVCYEDASPMGPYAFVTKMRPLWGLVVLGLSVCYEDASPMGPCCVGA